MSHGASPGLALECTVFYPRCGVKALLILPSTGPVKQTKYLSVELVYPLQSKQFLGIKGCFYLL